MVFDLMVGQHGLVTSAQALERGLSRRRIATLVANGEWVREAQGVYRHAATPSTWHSELLVAVLASGGVASHGSAAALWGLQGWRDAHAEVTIPHGRSHRGLAAVHRTTQWDRIDRSVRQGVPCTGVERTILDLGAARVASVRKVELAAESALRQGLTTWPKLRACLIRHARRGRDGVGRLRRVLEARHGDDPLPRSEWSRLVHHMLTDAGLPAAELEYPVVDASGDRVMDLDLAWPEQRVGIELDSVRWHLNRTSFERDRRKRNRARLLGWVIHEVTWSMSVGDREGLIALVRQAISR